MDEELRNYDDNDKSITGRPQTRLHGHDRPFEPERGQRGSDRVYRRGTRGRGRARYTNNPDNGLYQYVSSRGMLMLLIFLWEFYF